ncbi:hypothetical protein YC2023_039554 [Brassica napus]
MTSNFPVQLMRNVPINGRIVSLHPFRPLDGLLDVLIIVTERHKVCVLQWDVSSNELITRNASMDIDACTSKHPWADQVAKRGLCAFPLDNFGELEKPFVPRMCNLLVKDVKFLYGCDVPTVAVLCQDAEGAHAKTYYVSQTGSVPVTGPWTRDNIDQSAGLLIALPTPLCGVLIVGEELIVYCSANTYKERPKPCFTAKSFGRLDGFRFLLGDDEGRLHLVAVSHENQRVTDLRVELLGETSIASTISYLGNSLVFVGSSCSDSQLIKIDLDAQGSRIQVLKKFVNLGPIHDLCLVDPEKHGQSQVVTCSGGSKYGSLRIVSKGINEKASLELEGIAGLWSLKSSVDEALDTFFVVSFIGETRIFAMNRVDELEETEIKGFLSEVRTLFCHDAVHNQIVQENMTLIKALAHRNKSFDLSGVEFQKLRINLRNVQEKNLQLAQANSHTSSVQTETGHAFLELKSLKTRLSYFIILQLP